MYLPLSPVVDLVLDDERILTRDDTHIRLASFRSNVEPIGDGAASLLLPEVEDVLLVREAAAARSVRLLPAPLLLGPEDEAVVAWTDDFDDGTGVESGMRGNTAKVDHVWFK